MSSAEPANGVLSRESDPMKILVTGGAGFIGSNFIRLILQCRPDHAIVNFDKLTYPVI